MSCQQTWVTRLLASRGKSGHECQPSNLASGFHNFQRLGGLGVQGAELGILRLCLLRRWGVKMPPAASGGKRV